MALQLITDDFFYEKIIGSLFAVYNDLKLPPPPEP